MLFAIYLCYASLTDTSKLNSSMQLNAEGMNISRDDAEAINIIIKDPTKIKSYIEEHNGNSWESIKIMYAALRLHIVKEIIKNTELPIDIVNSTKNIGVADKKFHNQYINKQLSNRVIKSIKGLVKSSRSINQQDVDSSQTMVEDIDPYPAYNIALIHKILSGMPAHPVGFVKSAKVAEDPQNPLDTIYRNLVLDELIKALETYSIPIQISDMSGKTITIEESMGGLINKNMFNEDGTPKPEYLTVKQAIGENGSNTAQLYFVKVNSQKAASLIPEKKAASLIPEKSNEKASSQQLKILAGKILAQSKNTPDDTNNFKTVLILKEVRPSVAPLEQKALEILNQDPIIHDMVKPGNKTLAGREGSVTFFPKITFSEEPIIVTIDGKKHYFSILHSAKGQDIGSFVGGYIEKKPDESARERALDMITKFATAMGNFHQFTNLENSAKSSEKNAWLYGYNHGDLHSGNAFWDGMNIYLIDNSTMMRSSNPKDLQGMQDLFLLLSVKEKYLTLNGQTRIHILGDCFRFVYKFFEIVDKSYTFTDQNNGQQLEPGLENMSNLISTFFKSYISTYPKEKQDSLKQLILAEFNAAKDWGEYMAQSYQKYGDAAADLLAGSTPEAIERTTENRRKLGKKSAVITIIPDIIKKLN